MDALDRRALRLVEIRARDGTGAWEGGKPPLLFAECSVPGARMADNEQAHPTPNKRFLFRGKILLNWQFTVSRDGCFVAPV